MLLLFLELSALRYFFSMVDIRNLFKVNEVDEISLVIRNYIGKETNLTKRTDREIRRWLMQEDMYIAFSKKEILGFIVCEKILGNFYELKSWFVEQKSRKKAIGKALLLRVISNKKKTYIASTFQEKIVEKLKRYGFVEKTVWTLPVHVLIWYIVTRNVSSLHKHIFKKKSILLIKQWIY